GDKSGEGATLNNISQIYSARGDYARALEYLEQSLKISREIGHKSGQIPTLHNMAYIALQAEDPSVPSVTGRKRCGWPWKLGMPRGSFTSPAPWGASSCSRETRRKGSASSRWRFKPVRRPDFLV
ncbi:MAG: tetratricopeptide repeat protein, partial [Acidobacteriota bacterium]